MSVVNKALVNFNFVFANIIEFKVKMPVSYASNFIKYVGVI